NRRSSIVECGSGVSTIYIGRLLREIGGRLRTVEHDESWAGWVRDQVKAEGLNEHVQLVVAPLEPSAQSWDGAVWYSVPRLEEALVSDSIDLLVVDGPHANT